MTFRTLPALLLVRILFCAQGTCFGQAEDATALLLRVAEKARNTNVLSASVVLTRDAVGTGLKRTVGTATLQKPNYAMVRLTGDDPPQVLASDGNTVITLADQTTYTKRSVDLKGEQIDTPWWNLPLRFFFTQSINPFGPQKDPAEKTRTLPNEIIAGQSYRVISISGTQPLAYTGKLYINASDVLQRTEVHFGPTTVFTAELAEIKFGLPVASSSFRFTPPSQAKLQAEDATDTLLALGQTAPDFFLPMLKGPKSSLSTQRKGAKATLVNFWYLNCPPCRTEFPEFEKLYENFHEQGFNIVAIDRGDEPAEIMKYVNKANLSFPIVLGGAEVKGSVFDNFRIESFPASYLLDQDGKIVYRTALGDAGGLRAALIRLGFK